MLYDPEFIYTIKHTDTCPAGVLTPCSNCMDLDLEINAVYVWAYAMSIGFPGSFGEEIRKHVIKISQVEFGKFGKTCNLVSWISFQITEFLHKCERCTTYFALMANNCVCFLGANPGWTLFSVALKIRATLKPKRARVLNLCYKGKKCSKKLYSKPLLETTFLAILTPTAVH